MSFFNLPVNGATPYASLSVFPASAPSGSLAMALNTSILYVFDGSAWVPGDATAGTVTSVAMTVPAFLSIAGSPITTSGTLAVSLSGTALPVLNGGTGVTTSTGTGSVVLSNTPTLVTPVIGAATGTSLQLSGLTASQAVVTDGSKNLTSLAYGTTAAASTLAQLDSNSNLQANNWVSGLTQFPSTTSVTLTVASPKFVQCTAVGGNVVTVTLPDATTLKVGHEFFIWGANGSTILVRDNGGALLYNAQAGGSLWLVLQSNGTSNGTWVAPLQSVSLDVFPATVFRDANNQTYLGTAFAQAYTTSTLNAANVGAYRMASTEAVGWRNNTSTGDLTLSKDTSDNLNWANNINSSNHAFGYTAVTTAAGTTVLTQASSRYVDFQGSTTQICVLPTVSATGMQAGWTVEILNHSSGNVDVQSSSGNSLAVVTNLQMLKGICILTSGTGTASWSWVVSTLGG